VVAAGVVAAAVVVVAAVVAAELAGLVLDLLALLELLELPQPASNSAPTKATASSDRGLIDILVPSTGCRAPCD
jgi:hypothetical protein